MTQYYSRVDYTYISGDSLFTIPFSYIKKENIKVYINHRETASYIFNSDSQILITEDLTEGDIITIKRLTDIDSRLVVFTNTSMMSKDNQNLSAQQTFNVVQELYDTMSTYEVDVDDKMENFKEDINTSLNTVLTAAQSVAALETAISTAATAAENAATAAQSALDTAEAFGDALTHIDRIDNPHNVTATQVGLGNCNNTSDLNKPISTATQAALDLKLDIKAGLIMMYGGYEAPTGWLVCDGSAVSRATYVALFTVIGTTFGTGDGSTTFNLPNLIDKFIFGSSSVGSTKSEATTTTSTGSANHSHSYLAGTAISTSTGGSGANHTHTYTKGVNGIGLLPIIKY